MGLTNKVGCCGALGLGVGAVGATYATIVGGYEIGTAVNNAIKLEPVIARGLVDIVMMGFVAAPAYAIGIWGGLGVGAAVGGVYHYISNKTANLFNKKIRN